MNAKNVNSKNEPEIVSQTPNNKGTDLKQRMQDYIRRCDSLEKEGFQCIFNKNKVAPKKLFLMDLFAFLKYICMLDGEINDREVIFVKGILGFPDEQMVRENLLKSQKTFSAEDQKVPSFLMNIIQAEKDKDSIVSTVYWINSEELIHFYEALQG